LKLLLFLAAYVSAVVLAYTVVGNYPIYPLWRRWALRLLSVIVLVLTLSKAPLWHYAQDSADPDDEDCLDARSNDC
jgi:membrane protein YdbS with pleckstrin-like domain